MEVKNYSFLDELSPAIIAELKQLEEDYNIQLVSIGPAFVPDGKRNVFMGMPLDPGMLQTYIPLFIKEWRLYPKSLIRKTKLRRILLCQDLIVNFVHQGAAPDPETKTIYFNLDALHLSKPLEQIEQFFREAIHHQLFHYLDYQIDLDIQNDAAWAKLNEKGFNYGMNHRWNRYDHSTINVTNRYPGFISQYSLINTAEDKAEIFSRMMLNLHEMECRAKDDLILGTKIERLKQIVKGYCPEMDDQFWLKIRYLERPRLTPKGFDDPWAFAHPTLPELPRLCQPVVVYQMNCDALARRTLLCHRVRRCCR